MSLTPSQASRWVREALLQQRSGPKAGLAKSQTLLENGWIGGLEARPEATRWFPTLLTNGWLKNLSCLFGRQQKSNQPTTQKNDTNKKTPNLRHALLFFEEKSWHLDQRTSAKRGAQGGLTSWVEAQNVLRNFLGRPNKTTNHPNPACPFV